MAPPRDCPCFSGARYAACCAPFHRGEREAPSPEALMRARYAAFALGLAPYLIRTLASDHADLGIPRDVLSRELSRARDRQRFLGLRILHTEEAGDDGAVMFYARIFEKGADRSFVELSRFRREETESGVRAWRYAAGIMVPKADLPKDLDALGPRDIEDLQTFGLRTRA